MVVKIRDFKNKPLTKIELFKLNQRINYISDLFEDKLHGDIVNNLEHELEYYIELLNKSIKATKIRKIGLKLVS